MSRFCCVWPLDSASLKKLEYLGLYQTGMTDASQVYFIEIRGLEDLDLRKTRVTDKGIEQLKDALPDCLILR